METAREQKTWTVSLCASNKTRVHTPGQAHAGLYRSSSSAASKAALVSSPGGCCVSGGGVAFRKTGECLVVHRCLCMQSEFHEIAKHQESRSVEALGSSLVHIPQPQGGLAVQFGAKAATQGDAGRRRATQHGLSVKLGRGLCAGSQLTLAQADRPTCSPRAGCTQCAAVTAPQWHAQTQPRPAPAPPALTGRMPGRARRPSLPAS